MASTGVVTASDGTRIYPYREAMEAFEALPRRTFSLSDLVLVILGAQDKPVHGRTLLMKEVFLLYEQVLKDRSSDPKFVKYRLGPYSFHITDLLRTLALDGVLERHGSTNSRSESFRLTPKGTEMAEEVMKKMPDSERRLVSAKRMGWDQLGVRGILNYVYTKYPEYKEKSVVKKRYEDVIWGRG